MALESNPKDTEAMIHLANISIQRNDSSKAKNHLFAALDVNANLAEAHFSLGIIAYAEGDLKVSQGHMQKSILLNPDMELRLAEWMKQHAPAVEKNRQDKATSVGKPEE